MSRFFTILIAISSIYSIISLACCSFLFGYFAHLRTFGSRFPSTIRGLCIPLPPLVRAPFVGDFRPLNSSSVSVSERDCWISAIPTRCLPRRVGSLSIYSRSWLPRSLRRWRANGRAPTHPPRCPQSEGAQKRTPCGRTAVVRRGLDSVLVKRGFAGHKRCAAAVSAPSFIPWGMSYSIRPAISPSGSACTSPETGMAPHFTPRYQNTQSLRRVRQCRP